MTLRKNLFHSLDVFGFSSSEREMELGVWYVRKAGGEERAGVLGEVCFLCNSQLPSL